MVNWKSKRVGDLLLLANGLALVVLLNMAAALYFFRIDLTEEKRFSIKPQTKQLLKQLEEPVYIEVFLAGELNPSFTRFQKSIRETLEEFRIYSNNNVRFTFTDPALATGKQAQQEFMQDLAARGIQPRNVIDNKDGQRVEKIIFPGALVSYAGAETGVSLLKGNPSAGSEVAINQSIEGVEYELANAIHKLTNTAPKRIGFLQGHGELDSVHIASLKSAVAQQYAVTTVEVNESNSLAGIDALIIAKPMKRFSEANKFVIDQYIMNGGKVLFLIDKLEATTDSASLENYFAFPYNLNLDDMLFRYGVRINPDLVQDRASALTPVVTDVVNGKPQLQLMEWPFYPLINQYAAHPLARNLDAVVTKFASSVDTVKAAGVTKTPLLFTSPNARAVTAPVKVSINDIRKELTPENFSNTFVLGYLLEGSFTSLYKNRLAPEGVSSPIVNESRNTRMIVLGDGDLARNEVNPRSGNPQQLGFDPYSNYTFANEELLLNCLAWLVHDDGLLLVRSKEVKIRPLNKDLVRQSQVQWQVINLLAPLLFIFVFGVVWAYARRQRYARF